MAVGGVKVISLGPWGGFGGDPWTSIASNGIAEITIYSGDVINSISFKDASGVICGKFGGRSPFFNDQGTQKRITIRWPSQYLMSISGTYGQYGQNMVVMSLSFITNFTTYGPFGTISATTTGGQAFSIPLADSVVVGFHGRSGYYLDALGVLVQPTNPRGSISLRQTWGGSGGEHPFSFKVDPSYIKQIIVYQGLNIKSISVKDANDHEYGPFGGLNPTDIGERAVIDIDGRTQRLTSISGTYGYFASMMVITSLSFSINGITQGPYGTQSGSSFSIPMRGSEVIGFYGRSGHYLDSIGIYVKPNTVDGI